jgi:hypothetical protein
MTATTITSDESVVALAARHQRTHGRTCSDEEWERLRAEPCGLCGEPYHRYCDHDPEHKWDGVACINSLLGHIAVLERALAATIASKDR